MSEGAILIDVDNTLYSSAFDTEALFVERIIEFICIKLHVSRKEAYALHEHWQRQCTSDLRGIVEEYHVSPEEFMDYVCAIDMSFLQPDEELYRRLISLPQKKYIYTDSSVGHARDVCTRLGIGDCFSGIFSSREGGFTCKRQPESFQRMLKYFCLDAKNCWLIDDWSEAVANAKSFGMKTVHICDVSENDDLSAPNIHIALQHIADFL